MGKIVRMDRKSVTETNAEIVAGYLEKRVEDVFPGSNPEITLEIQGKGFMFNVVFDAKGMDPDHTKVFALADQIAETLPSVGAVPHHTSDTDTMSGFTVVGETLLRMVEEIKTKDFGNYPLTGRKM